MSKHFTSVPYVKDPPLEKKIPTYDKWVAFLVWTLGLVKIINSPI